MALRGDVTVGVSREEFRLAVRRVPAAMADVLAPVIEAQANLVAREIVGALADHHKTGHLGQSVRVEDGGKKTRKLVLAGGPLTTKPVRRGSSAQFDYALAEEYGTRHESAKPYFWPTVHRLEKQVELAIAQAVAGALVSEVQSSFPGMAGTQGISPDLFE